MAKRDMIPEVAGLTPMEASDLVHEESSHIAKQLALRAMPEGKNVIWDITMSSQDSVERRITTMRTAGYARIEGIFVDIPVDVGVTIDRTPGTARGMTTTAPAIARAEGSYPLKS